MRFRIIDVELELPVFSFFGGPSCTVVEQLDEAQPVPLSLTPTSIVDMPISWKTTHR